MSYAARLLAVFMGAALLLGACGPANPSATTEAPAAAAPVDELNRAVQQLLAPGQTVAEVRALSSTDGEVEEAEPQKAVVTGDLDGDGEEELVVGYRGPEQAAGVFIARRTPQGWQKFWEEEIGPPGLEALGAEDLTGDGRPEVIIGGIIGASAGNHLKVISCTPSENEETPSFSTLWETGYHRLEVGDFDGDNRREVALWTKDTGPAFAVEVYRWAPAQYFPAGFYEAEDAYTAYFPRVVDYYQEQLRRMPDAAFLWYYLALSQVRAGRPAEALTAVEKGLALKAEYPAADQWELVKGQALLALGRYEEALAAFGRITALDDANGRVPPIFLAQAYYGTGLAWEELGRYDRAAEAYTRAAELRKGWVLPARARERLKLRPAVDKVTAYLEALKPEEREKALREIGAWGDKHGLYLAALKAESPEGLPETWLVDLKAGPFDGTVDVHLICWWEEGAPAAEYGGSGSRFKYQAFYSVEAQEHGLGPTHRALSGRLALARAEGAEMAAVYDSAFSGSGSPRPELYLLRRQGDGWRILWRPPYREWRHSHGSITFTGAALEEFVLQGDSWEVGDGKDQIFHEANAGPHRRFRDVWQRQGDAYRRVSAETLASAYNTLVEFVYQLSLGQEQQAAQWVVDRALISRAKEYGLVQRPLGQRWLLDLPDPAVEVRGPLTIVSGPAAGVRAIFVNREGKWLLKDLEKDSLR
ncbi:MAG: tetratricopeptide repeat protein [Moorellales bacterium]